MVPATPSTTTPAMERNEDWGVYNDEGFVYKRVKRSRISGSGEASKPVEPESDPAVEERNRRMRKKRTLVKLKRKYQNEMEQWEILSNSFSAMREKAVRFQTAEREERRLNASKTASSSEHGGEDALKTTSSMLVEFLSVAEAQEAIINDVSNLCEVAENLCRVEQQQEESLFDLDVWCSPRSLMVSLCAD
ncbi:Cryptic loci regulator [Hirschfeldia incana]|nr:Cryptic loci regulator [Hirschfeldia incana]